jgi:hypothetical protein
MRKGTEMITSSVAVYPTSSTGISSSALYDMTQYERFLISTIGHKLPDGKGEGVLTATVYQSTASTWNGAAAITLSSGGVGTASITSASDAQIRIDLKQSDLTENSDYKYVGVRVASSTATAVACIVKKYEAKNEPV